MKMYLKEMQRRHFWVAKYKCIEFNWDWS